MKLDRDAAVPVPMTHQYDLLVIGAGPGGYVSAIRAAQLGMSVGCVDANARLGGTCLRVGCIPSKALLESSEQYAEARNGLAEHGIQIAGVELDLAGMLRRKDRVVETLTKGIGSLFRKHGITHHLATARFEAVDRVIVESEGKTTELQAKHIVIATGSRPTVLPGVTIDGDRIGTSTEALCYDEVPRHLVVIGAGYIGLEMAAVWLRLGARVTVLEYLDRILPGSDAEIATEARKLFEKQGIVFRLGSRVTGVAVKGSRCRVECAGSEPLECDRVLVAVGRSPNTQGLQLEAVRIDTDAKGFIRVDERFRTAAPGVYAIGDVIGGPLLAHKAQDEGIACVEHIVTGYGHVNYDAIPSVVYTNPEIAAVGSTEEELMQSGREYRKGVFPFRANGRARALGHAEGWVKVLADLRTDRLLGVHIIGPRAGDLIAEAAVAIEFGASSEDLARCSHAHPTLAEALKEAALALGERAVHL